MVDGIGEDTTFFLMSRDRSKQSNDAMLRQNSNVFVSINHLESNFMFLRINRIDSIVNIRTISLQLPPSKKERKNYTSLNQPRTAYKNFLFKQRRVIKYVDKNVTNNYRFYRHARLSR